MAAAIWRPTVFSDEDWEAACSQCPNGITMIVDSRGLAIDDIAPTCAHYLGASPADLRGLPFRALVHPDDADALAAAFRAAEQGGGAAGGGGGGVDAGGGAGAGAGTGPASPLRFRMVTNRQRYTTAFASIQRVVPTANDGGGQAAPPSPLHRPLFLVVAVPTPQLDVLSPELSGEDELQAGLFRAHLDASLRFRFASPACADVLGYAPTELLRRALPDVMAPAYAAPALAFWKRVARNAGGYAATIPLALQHRYVASARAFLYLRGRGRPVGMRRRLSRSPLWAPEKYRIPCEVAELTRALACGACGARRCPAGAASRWMWQRA